jgi:hypothetical protein
MVRVPAVLTDRHSATAFFCAQQRWKSEITQFHVFWTAPPTCSPAFLT